MNSVFVVSFAGKDRPGVIQQIAETTDELGGKWLQSKVIRLEGRISAIIKIDIPARSVDQLKDFINSINDMNVTYSDPQPEAASGTVARLRIDAKDRPGIVNDISRLLVGQSMRPHNFESSRIGVVNLGCMFTANFEVELPEGVAPADVVAQLQALSDEFVVSVTDS